MKFKAVIIGIFALFLGTAAIAQNDYDTTAPYLKDANLPNFLLLRQDSTWLSTAQLPKKKPVVITFFNPDCEHCQHEATQLAKNMKKLDHIEFVWATYAPSFEEIDDFATKYKLKGLKNVHFVKDVNYAIPSFYRLKMTPYMAVYDKNKQLLKTFPMGVSPEELLQLIK